jgi:hypothetical protein
MNIDDYAVDRCALSRLPNQANALLRQIRDGVWQAALLWVRVSIKKPRSCERGF